MSSEQVMNLGGDYAVTETSCSFCTSDPFAPVKASCFGLRDSEPEPTYGCDTCCDHSGDGDCAPVGMPVACGICHVEAAAKWGVSFCYGCQTHVCAGCVERAPNLPERHAKEAHPTPIEMNA